MHYNFVRIHQTLRVTPAMAAGMTDRVWEISDIVKLLEEREERIAEKQRPERMTSFYKVYGPAGEPRKNRRPAADA
jgi:hypothetical protein